jgi:hypothetical protein
MSYVAMTVVKNIRSEVRVCSRLIILIVHAEFVVMTIFQNQNRNTETFSFKGVHTTFMKYFSLQCLNILHKGRCPS